MAAAKKVIKSIGAGGSVSQGPTPPSAPSGGGTQYRAPSGGQRGRSAPTPPQGSRSAGQTPGKAKSLRPAPEPPEARPFWWYGVDPNRQRAGQSINVLGFQTSGHGIKIPEPIRQAFSIADTEINLGDIAPNIQDIGRPIFRPNASYEEKGGRLSETELQPIAGQTLKAVQSINSGDLAGFSQAMWGENRPQSLQEIPGAILPRFSEAADTFSRYYGSHIPLVGDLPEGPGATFWRGLTGTIPAVAELLNKPSQGNEQTIGLVAQGLGLSPRTVLAASPMVFGTNQGLGGQALAAMGEVVKQELGIPTNTQIGDNLRTSAANAVDELAQSAPDQLKGMLQGMANSLRPVSNDPNAPTSLNAPEFAELVATARVWSEGLGMGTGAFDTVLNAIAPQQKDALISNARQFVQASPMYRDFTGDRTGKPLGVFPAFYASTFTYESPERLLEARARLENGESMDAVLADVQDKVTFREQMRDIGYNLVYDPLNMLDYVKVGGIGGGPGERLARWVQSDAGRLLVETPNGNGMKNWDEWGDITKPRGLERLPDWFPLTAHRTAATRADRMAEEAGQVVLTITESIPEDAVTRLAAEGIRENPRRLLLDILMNPYSDDVAGTGKSADDLRHLLGMDSHVVSPSEAKYLRIEEGITIDPFKTDAADRARYLLEQMGQQKGNAFLEAAQETSERYRQMLREGNITITHKGEELALKGNDAWDAVDQSIDTLIDRFDEVAKQAAGYKPPKGFFADRIQDWRNLQGAVARYFHMGPNPGFATRNWVNNSVVLVIDDVDVLTPLQRVRQEMDRLELITPELRRTLGGGIEDLGKRNILTGTIFKPLEWARGFERNASQRAILAGFQRFMDGYWQVGRAIPEEDFARLMQSLGDVPEMQAMLESARTVGDLTDIRRALTEGEGWRLVGNTDLGHRIDRMDLSGPVQDILRNSSTPEEAIGRLDLFAQQLDTQVADMARTRPFVRGSVEGTIMDDVAAVSEHLDDPGAWDEFRRRQAIWKETNDRLHASVQMAIDGMDDATQARTLQRDLTGLMRDAQSRYDQVWSRRDAVIRALRDGNLDDLRAIDPLFRNVQDTSEGWDLYRAFIDGEWQAARGGTIEGMLKLGDRAGWAGRPNLSQIEELIRLTPIDQHRYFGQMYHLATTQYGFKNMRHIRNWLVKHGFFEGDKFFSADIVNMDWYNRVMAEMSQHGDDIADEGKKIPDLPGVLPPRELERWNASIKQARQASNEAALIAQQTGNRDYIERAEELAVDLQQYLDDFEEWKAGYASPIDNDVADALLDVPVPRADLVPPGDLIAGTAARVTEQKAILQDVMDDLLRRADTAPRKFSDLQIEQLDNFLRDMQGRMVSARELGKTAGGHVRDFALHNYEDKRGFDNLLAVLFNYPTWHTRNTANFALRVLDSPGRVAALTKLRRGLEQMNRDKPEWWRDQISLDFGGTHIYLPLLAMIDPLNGPLGDRFTDSELANTPYGAFLQEMQNYGPGLHVGIQSMMMLDAYRRGNEEEALSWMNYLGQPTRGINALSVLARTAGADFIPPGGIALEPWLWRVQNGEYRTLGSKYDARRIGQALAEMYAEGTITQEQMYDAMLSQEGPIFDQALQRSKENTAVSVLLSWLGGAGLKPRPEMEIEVQRMDADVRLLMDQKADMSPEAYRQAWAQLRDQYPWMDAVRAFRRDDVAKQEIYAWSVFNRLPPHNRPYIEALGIDADVYSALLDKFYQDKGLEGMSDLEREQFMNLMKQLGAVLALPDDATGAQWDAARAANRAMYARLLGDTEAGIPGEFPGADLLETEYYRILNQQDQAAATAFLQSNPQLQAYWDRRDQLKAADPLLAKYYGSMEMLERVAKDEFEAEQEQQHPGLHASLDQYYQIKSVNPEAASDYLEEHPELKAYWNACDVWTMGLDERLSALTASIDALGPHWAALRADMDVTTPGQQRVADLIQSGANLGDFELPEDLSYRQLQAAIKIELNDIPDGQWGTLLRDLKAMGDLDDTLSAFQEWGSGKKNVDVVQIHETELRALLTALGDIRESRGWEPQYTVMAEDGSIITNPAQYYGWVRGDDGRLKVRAEDGTWVDVEQYYGVRLTRTEPRGGSRSSTRGSTTTTRRTRTARGGQRVRTSRWGGARARRSTPAQEQQQTQDLTPMLSDLQQRAPLWFSKLNVLTGYSTEAEWAAFLDLPENALFRSWLRSVLASGIAWAALLAAMKRFMTNVPAAKSKSSSSTAKRAGMVRYSVPGLNG